MLRFGFRIRSYYSNQDGDAGTNPGTDHSADASSDSSGTIAIVGGTQSESGVVGSVNPGTETADRIVDVGGTLDIRQDQQLVDGIVPGAGTSAGAGGTGGSPNGTQPNSSHTGTVSSRAASAARKAEKLLESQQLDLNKGSQQQPIKVPNTAVVAAKTRSSVKAGDIDPKEVKMFLVGCFGLVGSFVGEHWIVKDDEAERIADPLVMILNKQNKKRKDSMNNLMAPMLLITAIGSVIIPRILISAHKAKEQKPYAEPTRRIEPGNRPLTSPLGNREIHADAATASGQSEERKQGDGIHSNIHAGALSTTSPIVITESG